MKKNNKKPLYLVVNKDNRVQHGEKTCVGFDMNGVCVWVRKKHFCCCHRGFKS